MSAPNAFVPIPGDLARRKIDHLMEHFGSQRRSAGSRRTCSRGCCGCAGMECNSPSSLRRGVLLPQGRARVTTTSRDRRPAPAPERGVELMRADVPALPQPHRRRGARHLRPDRGADPARPDRGPERRPRLRLDRPGRVEPARRLRRDRGRHAASIDFRDSNLHVVSYSEPVRRDDDARRAARAAAHAPRPARPDPVQDVVLRRAPGASASPTTTARASRRASTRS